MQIIEVDGPGPLLDAVYRDILTPSFPPVELCAVGGMARGDNTVTAVVDDDGTPVAAAVGDWSERSRVQLLSYLAVTPAFRGTGIGGRLLTHVLDAWRARYAPCVVVAEIEHPADHAGSEAYGDPTARARFYARHGAVALDVPYFQPALRPADGRYYGMILILLHHDGPLSGPALREFMVEYLEMTEGAVGTDAATTALLSALDPPGGVRTVPLDDLDAIPRSTDRLST